ncbi:MAG TPA: MBL fold metallo-hydrolase [Thermoplasmata archaeon]|nr:MBL fold metallo-hydrolase [Thermoplasmata archaeon]
MKICWYGHSCFEIANGSTLVTDPHDGRSIGIRKPEIGADLVLVSHDHYDHNSVRTVSKQNTRVINEVTSLKIKGIKIQGFPTFHDESGGAKRGKNILFKFCMEGINFLHSGDLGHLIDDELAKKIGEVDILFIPVGGIFTIDAENAWKVVEKLKPKVAIPMHYKISGLSIPLDEPDLFLRKAEEKVVRVGNEIDFTKEDLPKDFEIWLFSL